MSNQTLDENDIDTLINLLLRSQQSRTREALCFSIGIDPKRLSFIRDSSESDFFLLLIRYLNEIGEQEALCKLCCKELLPVFRQGKYASMLSEIAAKLDCNQRLSQDFTNNKEPTIPSPISSHSDSVNPFNQLVKNKLIMGGTIILVAFTGLSLFLSKPNNNSQPNLPSPQQPVASPNTISQPPQSVISPSTMYHGAIAVEAQTGNYGYAVRYTSKEEANSASVQKCNTMTQGRNDCVVRVWFTDCGALASNSSRIEWGVGSSASEAQDNAIKRLGGGRIITVACNQ